MADVARTGEAAISLPWRIAMVAAGFGIAMAGWTLVMTALLAFIGIPLFVFGLAMMEAAAGGKLR
jgi:hypothetical protein